MVPRFFANISIRIRLDSTKPQPSEEEEEEEEEEEDKVEELVNVESLTSPSSPLNSSSSSF